MMRVLLAQEGGYPDTPLEIRGGLAQSTHALCLQLRERGIPFAVASSDEWGKAADARKVAVLAGGSADEVMGYRVYRSRDLQESVAEIAASFGATAIVAQGAHSLLALTARCLAAGFPTFPYFRGVWFHGLIRRTSLPWFDLAHPLVGYLANSHFTAERYEKSLGVRSTVIHSIIRPEAYRAKTDRTKVIFVNPIPIKGVEIALKLAEARPDIPFEFIENWGGSDGLSATEFAALEQRARLLGNVRVRRFVADMREVYGVARILLAPSIGEESWGRVVTEAQVSGIPVLASHRGGLPESVGAGGIVLNPEGDIAPWVAALSRLWDDQAAYDRYVQAALAHAQRPEIQPDHLVDSLLAVLSAAAAKRRA